MARQKTNKTTVKRFKVTNPKGNKKGKILFKQSHQNHLKTKQSRLQKRRQLDSKVVSKGNAKNIIKKAVNL
jgi:ribosomal protein L35